jgi:hypothetical protein
MRFPADRGTPKSAGLQSDFSDVPRKHETKPVHFVLSCFRGFAEIL